MTARSARPTPVPDVEPLYSPQDVMALLGCSRSFVQDHRAALGCRRVGVLLRFPRSAVLAFIERGAIAPTAVTAEHADPTPIRPDIDVSGLPDISPVTGLPFSWSTRI